MYLAHRRGGQAVMTIEARIAEQAARQPEFADLRARQLAAALVIHDELFAALPFGPDGLAVLA